jgi:hypothetical protein
LGAQVLPVGALVAEGQSCHQGGDRLTPATLPELPPSVLPVSPSRASEAEEEFFRGPGIKASCFHVESLLGAGSNGIVLAVKCIHPDAPFPLKV